MMLDHELPPAVPPTLVLSIFARERKQCLVDDLAVANAPDVGRADVAFALADGEVTPAVAALLDTPDDTLLGVVAHPARAIGVGMNRLGLARLHDRRAPVAEQRDEHPSAGSFGIL